MNHVLTVSALTLLLLGGGGMALAQDQATAALPTVKYGDHDVEINPAQGPIQCLIVRREESRIEDLDGVNERATIDAAVFIHAAGGWQLAGTAEWPAEGKWNLQVEADCTSVIGAS